MHDTVAVCNKSSCVQVRIELSLCSLKQHVMAACVWKCRYGFTSFTICVHRFLYARGKTLMELIADLNSLETRKIGYPCRDSSYEDSVFPFVSFSLYGLDSLGSGKVLERNMSLEARNSLNSAVAPCCNVIALEQGQLLLHTK